MKLKISLDTAIGLLIFAVIVELTVGILKAIWIGTGDSTNLFWKEWETWLLLTVVPLLCTGIFRLVGIKP